MSMVILPIKTKQIWSIALSAARGARVAFVGAYRWPGRSVPGPGRVLCRDGACRATCHDNGTSLSERNPQTEEDKQVSMKLKTINAPLFT